MNKDKIIGLFLILFSIAVIGATIVLTIVLPAIDFDTYQIIGYYVIAGIISFAILVIMLLLAWIGWTLIITPAPEEIDFEDLDEEENESSKDEEKENENK
ncbi:MAG: hypothetical protein K9W45_08085 [Candidatus Heimdallarchaeum aukensis]|uniref:Uncharacterized protein n=1 Tax=Candidatus Heimdallarchaeum aukensis TaxID=2876573 RepID=A0A9Y1BIP2_9ARCH|nr:MAG: hypothetical protein K9W45_08085 [Candidatus Heimdallarchaeum aukensis]